MAADKYLSYTARDFAMDESFQDWVLHPGQRNVFWETWVQQHPEKNDIVHTARQLVESIRFRNYSISAQDKEQLWDAVWNGLNDEGTPLVQTRSQWSNAWKYAAAILLGIILASAWWWKNTDAPATVLSAHTRLGETRNLLLPDSSQVTLNANSRLLYTTGSKGKREVWLDGQAFFHVRHTAANQKFIVHTYDNLNVEVLGTQFDVNSNGREIVVVLQQEVYCSTSTATKVRRLLHSTCNPGKWSAITNKPATIPRKVWMRCITPPGIPDG